MGRGILEVKRRTPNRNGDLWEAAPSREVVERTRETLDCTR
jgi:hypothetical protein